MDRRPARFGPGLDRMLMGLALLALCLRAITPDGYMLNGAPGRLLTVTLCSTHGGETTLDLDTGTIAPGKSTKSEIGSPCLFAAAACLAPPELALALPCRGVQSLCAPVIQTGLAPGRGLAAPPPWPTGPPLQT